jgi:hypothetical protein
MWPSGETKLGLLLATLLITLRNTSKKYIYLMKEEIHRE